MVQRAPDAPSTLIQNVRVDHRRTDVPVPEQLLDRPDVVPRLQQVRREGVTERVTRRRPGNPSRPGRLLDGSLHHRLVQMVPPPLARGAIDAWAVEALADVGLREFEHQEITPVPDFVLNVTASRPAA